MARPYPQLLRRYRTNTIAQNAEILSEYIGNVQQATGAEQVDLLVHSMGGIIARYYLDRVMPTRNVAQLIILGSPMGGSSCSVLPAALGLLMPAALELQPSYMQKIFNPQITRRQGVPFHALAGTKFLNPVQSPCTDVPSDLVVSLASVKAIAMPVQEMAILHSALNDASDVYLGYGFVQPKAGQWIVALQTTAETTAAGADYAIAAQFNGGASLQTTVDNLIPQVNEPVNLRGQLNAAGQAITLTSAQARVRRPDGQVETYPLVVQGESVLLTLTPIQSGLYGVELNVSAQTEEGLTIDRAAFSVFEAQPTAATDLFIPGIFLLLVLLSLILFVRPVMRLIRPQRVRPITR